MRLKEWNLTPMQLGAKPKECLGQANFGKDQWFSINLWDLNSPYQVKAVGQGVPWLGEF